MRQFYDLLVANFKMTVRNRQSLFWLFLFPVMLMALFGIAFSDGQTEPKLGVVDHDRSEISEGVKTGFKKADVVEYRELKSETAAKNRLKEGDLDGVVVVRKGLAADIERIIAANRPAPPGPGKTPPPTGEKTAPAKVDFYFDPSNTFVSGVTQGLVSNVVANIDRAVSGAPIVLTLKSHSVRQRNLRYIDFLVPGIIAMTLMNSAMFGLGGTIVNYRERGILRRLKVTPQPLPIFLAAQITNQLIFSIIRALLLVVVARLMFDVHVIGDYFLLLLVVVIGSLAFVTIAFAVASFSKNREIADSLGNLVSMPMMFLGGVFFPTDGAPAWIKPVINAMPLKYLADAMRGVMIKGDGFAAIDYDLLVLVGTTLIFFALSARLWRWE